MIAYVALGSNLGDRQQNIQWAIASLRRLASVYVQHSSPLYENPPLGLPAGASPFLNGMVELETQDTAQTLLKQLLDIEQQLGRVRETLDRKTSRIIDLDLILYGDEMLHEDGLTVPHPELLNRWFVLKPLADLCPHRMIPGTVITAERALQEIEKKAPEQIGSLLP